MNRWSFIGGLTITLLLLLLLSGFSIWATRGLTDDIETLINQNYDSIRAVRDLRSAVTRISGYYLAAQNAAGIPKSREIYRHDKTVIESRLAQLMKNARGRGEREKIARLRALCVAYFAACDELLRLRPDEDARFDELGSDIARLTGTSGDLADQIVDHNEEAMMARHDAVVARGWRITFITAAFAVFSVGIYVLTSLRLAHGVFEPLRRLRDSIQQVSARRFDAVIPIQDGEELGQIASSFNRMAAELHRYVHESDERAVRASEMNRAVLEALPYPVYFVDGNFHVRLANPRAEELSRAAGVAGSLPAEVRRLVDQASAQGADAVGDDIRRAVSLPTGETTADGPAHRDYLPQIFQMPAAFDGERGWAVLLVDVTGLRRMDQAKTRALSVLGHEVKTPVAGIRMTLHLLLEEKLGQLDPLQRELVEAGFNDCERLLTVLRTLLELAQLESGRVRLALAPHAPSELLSETFSVHVEAARRAEKQLRLEIPPELPAVLAEPFHAMRVLGNFLSNALKFGVPGRPVTLRAQRRGDGYVRLSVVNDIEQPLTEAEQAKIFDPFFRRPGENADGAGLGLAISREIAAVHGGRIGVFCPAAPDSVEFFLDLRIAA